MVTLFCKIIKCDHKKWLSLILIQPSRNVKLNLNFHAKAISWTDPREEEERRRLKAKLAAETQAIGLLASTSKAAAGNSVAAADQGRCSVLS